MNGSLWGEVGDIDEKIECEFLATSMVFNPEMKPQAIRCEPEMKKQLMCFSDRGLLRLHLVLHVAAAF